MVQTVGRRKRAIARIVMSPGSGEIKVNGRAFDDYFPSDVHRALIAEPLKVVNSLESYDIVANVDGGGLSGQAGAFRLAIARALVAEEGEPGEARGPIKAAGMLTRDPRKKESKKYGLKKARKAPQYSKR